MRYRTDTNIRLTSQPEVHLFKLATVRMRERFVIRLLKVALPAPIEHGALRGQDLIQIALHRDDAIVVRGR